MTDLFLDVFNASVAASWVVLAIIAARLLLKKAPRWMFCGLWALVAVRLLWPALPQSPVSLLPSREIIPPRSLYAAAPVIDSGVSFIDNAINPVYTESLRPVPGASVNPLQIWLAVLGNLWILGMAVMALWALWSCLINAPSDPGTDHTRWECVPVRPGGFPFPVRPFPPHHLPARNPG